MRNAQERRQLGAVEQHLISKGYKHKTHPSAAPITEMEPGTFSFRLNALVKPSNADAKTVKIPVDAVILSQNIREAPCFLTGSSQLLQQPVEVLQLAILDNHLAAPFLVFDGDLQPQRPL